MCVGMKLGTTVTNAMLAHVYKLYMPLLQIPFSLHFFCFLRCCDPPQNPKGRIKPETPKPSTHRRPPLIKSPKR